MWSGRRLLTFQRYLLPPSSQHQEPLKYRWNSTTLHCATTQMTAIFRDTPLLEPWNKRFHISPLKDESTTTWMSLLWHRYTFSHPATSFHSDHLYAASHHTADIIQMTYFKQCNRNNKSAAPVAVCMAKWQQKSVWLEVLPAYGVVTPHKVGQCTYLNDLLRAVSVQEMTNIKYSEH
jgi:hypothetical protein